MRGGLGYYVAGNDPIRVSRRAWGLVLPEAMGGVPMVLATIF